MGWWKTATVDPAQYLYRREALMREEWLDAYIQFYRDKLAHYAANLQDPANNDPALLRDVMMQNMLWLFIARYSRGEPLELLKPTFPELVDALADCIFEEVPNPVNFLYLEGYVRALWLVSLALLFDVETALFERLLALIGQPGQDALYDRLLSLRMPATPTTADLLYPEPYQSLYQAIQLDGNDRDAAIRLFLKQFYRSMSDTGWYDLHLRKPPEFFGYWCFSLAAFVKALDLPDSAFADNYYYPRDLTGRRLFRTWDDTAVGQADRLAYREWLNASDSADGTHD